MTDTYSPIWRCVNCGGQNAQPALFAGKGAMACGDCGWLIGNPLPEDAKDQPLCSVCRRRHGPEVRHERE